MLLHDPLDALKAGSESRWKKVISYYLDMKFQSECIYLKIRMSLINLCCVHISINLHIEWRWSRKQSINFVMGD